MKKFGVFILLFAFLFTNNVIGTESTKDVGVPESQKTVLLMKMVEMNGNELTINDLAGNLSWSGNPREDNGFGMYASTDMTSLRSDFWDGDLTLTLPADYKIARLMDGPQQVFVLGNEDSFVVWGDVILKSGNIDLISIIHYRVVNKFAMRDQLLDWLFSGFLSERGRKGIPNFLKDHFDIQDVESEFARRRKERGKNPETDHFWSPSEADKKAYPMTPDGYVDVAKMIETTEGKCSAFRLLAELKGAFDTDKDFHIKDLPVFSSLVSIKISVTRLGESISPSNIERLFRVFEANPFLTNLEITSDWHNIPLCLLNMLERLPNLTTFSINGIDGVTESHRPLVNALFSRIPTLKSVSVKGNYRNPHTKTDTVCTFDIKRPADAPYKDSIVPKPLYFLDSQRNDVWDVMMTKLANSVIWLNNAPSTMQNVTVYISYQGETMTIDWGSIAVIWSDAYSLVEIVGKALNTKLTWINQVKVRSVTSNNTNSLFQLFPDFKRRDVLPSSTVTDQFDLSLNRSPLYADPPKSARVKQTDGSVKKRKSKKEK